MAGLQIFPAGKHVEAQYVEMKVPLYSYGCEKKIKKALSHMRGRYLTYERKIKKALSNLNTGEGIHSVHVDYHLQKVVVWGICNKDDVLATIRKKRREARFWDQMATEVKNKAAEEEVDATEVNNKAAEKEVDAANAPNPATVNMHKFRKSWKKQLPLVQY